MTRLASTELLELVALGPDDLHELGAALTHAGLQTCDLCFADRSFFGFDNAGDRVGFGGMEGDAPDLLLRSIVVNPLRRGRGHGGQIVHALDSLPRRVAQLGYTC